MKQTVFIALIGVCIGIAIGECRTLGIHIAILFLCVTLSFIAAKQVLFKFYAKTISVSLILLCGATLGIIRTEYAYIQLPQPVFENTVGTKKELQVKVVSPVDLRDDSARFIVEPLLNKDHPDIQLPRIRLVLPRVNEVMYGDILTIEGILTSVVTNSKTYIRVSESLIRKGIMYEMRMPKIVITEHGKGNYFYTKLYSFGDSIKHTINIYIREPGAAFVNGILLGEKHGLSDKWYDAFTHVGLTHVIVLSGYNLAIMFAWTKILLRKTPFLFQHLFGALAVISLVLISGADAPAIRAAILVLTASLAALLRRQEDSGYFLSVTVFIMLLWNPFYLLYDVSFQLSVAATYGLTYLAPILGQYIFSKPRFGHELIRDTLGAQIAVLPLQLLYFGTLSWVSIFANILILPLIPILMVLGVITLLTSIIPFLAFCVGTVTTVLADITLAAVFFLASHTEVFSISISVGACLLLYLVIIIFILHKEKRI